MYKNADAMIENISSVLLLASNSIPEQSFQLQVEDAIIDFKRISYIIKKYINESKGESRMSAQVPNTNPDTIICNLQKVTTSNYRTVIECDRVIIQPKKLHGSDYLLKPELFALVEDKSLRTVDLDAGTYMEMEGPDANYMSTTEGVNILMFYSDVERNKFWFSIKNGAIISHSLEIESSKIVSILGDAKTIKEVDDLNSNSKHIWFFVK